GRLGLQGRQVAVVDELVGQFTGGGGRPDRDSGGVGLGQQLGPTQRVEQFVGGRGRGHWAVHPNPAERARERRGRRRERRVNPTLCSALTQATAESYAKSTAGYAGNAGAAEYANIAHTG